MSDTKLQLFSDTPDPGLQQEIQQMLDQLYPELNNPSSGFYLPTFVQKGGYDPYTVQNLGTWDLTDAQSLQLASTICGGNPSPPCSQADYYINDPSVTVTLVLTNVQITGLSNVILLQPQVQPDGLTVDATLQFSTLPTLFGALIANVTVAGDYQLNLNCCCSADQTTCISGTSSPEQGNGTFTATIAAPLGQGPSSVANMVFVITNIAPGVLTLQASSLNFAMGANATMTFQVTGQDPAYNNIVNNALNNGGEPIMLQNINSIMNQPATLTQLSNMLTSEIDGYLQKNNMYPFNEASLSLY